MIGNAFLNGTQTCNENKGNIKHRKKLSRAIFHMKALTRLNQYAIYMPQTK